MPAPDRTGREHPGQGPVADSEVSASTIPHPNDSSAMRAYVESYSYDEVGNILEIDHDCSGTTYDWTRTNTYASGNNKLATSQITGSSSFTYTHDDRGNMTAMPHLSSIGWDYADRMQSADLGGGGDVYFTYDSSGQRVRKVWDKTSSLRDERIYLGAFELWRESTVSGGTASVQEERQTVHVMDDVRRVAMVETKTVTSGNAVSPADPRQRFQLSNQVESASVELTEDGSIISYEEYFPFGATSFRSAGSTPVSTSTGSRRTSR